MHTHGLAQTMGGCSKRARNKGKWGDKRTAVDPSIEYLAGVKKVHLDLCPMAKEAMEVTQSGSGSDS